MPVLPHARCIFSKRTTELKQNQNKKENDITPRKNQTPHTRHRQQTYRIDLNSRHTNNPPPLTLLRKQQLHVTPHSPPLPRLGETSPRFDETVLSLCRVRAGFRCTLSSNKEEAATAVVPLFVPLLHHCQFDAT